MAVDPGAVRTLFKTQLEAITGVTVAHKYTPAGIVVADCPQFLIVPAVAAHGAETTALPAFGKHAVEREWRLILLVAKAGSVPYGEVEADLDVFYERVEDQLRLRGKLASTDANLNWIELLGDTGESLIEWPPTGGSQWIGTEWRVKVRTSRAVTVGA